METKYILLIIVLLVLTYKVLDVGNLIEGYYPWWRRSYPWWRRRWRYPYYWYQHYPYYDLDLYSYY
jgi:hypothetical protein